MHDLFDGSLALLMDPKLCGQLFFGVYHIAEFELV